MGAGGKLLRLDKQIGEQVKKGDTVFTIEAMQMEIPIVAPESGEVATINANVGDDLIAGTIVATIDVYE